MSLKDIFKEKAYEKKGNWLTAYNHFSTFCKDLENFDIQAFNDYSMKFGRYLSEKGLKNSSINVYLKILKNFLKNNGGNPELVLLKKEGEKTLPEYLNESSLLWLEESECADIHLKNAALFSASTGLRLKDIKNLNSNHIIENITHLVPAKQIQKIMGYANIASARIFEDVVINRAV